MGKRTRQRRAAATHRAHAGASARSTAPHPTAPRTTAPRPDMAAGVIDGRYDPRAVISTLVDAGMRAALAVGTDRARSGSVLRETIDQLVTVGRDDLVDDVVVEHLARLVAPAWERGWSPVDLVHAVTHRFDATLGGLVARAVLADPTLVRDDRPTVWSDQLDQVRSRRARRSSSPDDVGKLVHRFEVAVFLSRLPDVVGVVPPPSAWRTLAATPNTGPPRSDQQVDPRMLERVRALLAKAESTTFDAEAEAFTGKAQELMAKYAIDAAMVAAAASGARSLAAGVEARRLHLDDPYAVQKAQLLGAVAAVNGGHVVWHEGWGFATVIGFPVELELIELTFTSLLVQLTRSMTQAGAAGGRTRSASFRRAFVLSYAQRIAERLEEARRRADGAAQAEYGAALVPVRAARRAAVQERSAEWFPNAGPMRTRSVDAGGWYAGRAAADAADLEPGLGQIT